MSLNLYLGPSGGCKTSSLVVFNDFYQLFYISINLKGFANPLGGQPAKLFLYDSRNGTRMHVYICVFACYTKYIYIRRYKCIISYLTNNGENLLIRRGNDNVFIAPWSPRIPFTVANPNSTCQDRPSVYRTRSPRFVHSLSILKQKCRTLDGKKASSMYILERETLTLIVFEPKYIHMYIAMSCDRTRTRVSWFFSR